MLFWTTADFENKLLDFRTYFNHRTHTSREGRTPDAPLSRPIVSDYPIGSYDANALELQPKCLCG
jgi:hypothetical protein